MVGVYFCEEQKCLLFSQNQPIWCHKVWNILLVWKLQHSWRYLVLVEIYSVHQNYHILKIYNHKLWLIFFPYQACSRLLFCNHDFGKPCSLVKSYIQFGLFWIFLSVRACAILGDFVNPIIFNINQTSQWKSKLLVALQSFSVNRDLLCFTA